MVILMNLRRSLSLASLLGLLALAGAKQRHFPRVFVDDFRNGADHWQPTDESAWKVTEGRKGHVYSQHKKRSDYEPPHRSPLNMSLVKDVEVTDFEMTVRVLSTHEDYGHRDVCLFFGYQSPSHFYYVHLGKKTDDHANQVFIVNDAPRVKISTITTDGTDWDDKWHTVRITRDTENGTIAVYYDDMKNPVMAATDKTFRWGRVGVGSFDDTGDWDDFRLRGYLRSE
jgi:hypothetical protein